MRAGARVAVVIPAYNEERAIGRVLAEVPAWVDQVIVADNGSEDKTREVARRHGAQVVIEPTRGYGSACLAGIAHLDSPDIVVFLDGDYSDYPHEMGLLVDPIVTGEADCVLGSRILGSREPGALTPQARFGNWLACALIRLLWQVEFTDLGPFRAIRYGALVRLDMRDPDYGWTVEMQIKAVRAGLRVREAPVSYRRRIGQSKVSGTVKGVVGAGTKILGTILLAGARQIWSDRFRGTRERAIVFTRYPEPGRTKTRLISRLGAESAARLHRLMTERTLEELRPLKQSRSVDIEVLFDGGSESLMKVWLGSDLSYRQQSLGDLGKRMHSAFTVAFSEGAGRVVLVGTDIPDLSRQMVGRALTALSMVDLVLTPTTDGGYCLIGLRNPHGELFSGVHWSTHTVLIQTLDAARRLGLSTMLLERLHDVDRPEDLKYWRQGVPSQLELDEATPSVTVIIPALNEQEHLQTTIAAIRAAGDTEIVVVDGGSTDGTMIVARSEGVRTATTSGGRSHQMNEGARLASGEILLFLHADTLLPPCWKLQVARAMASPRIVGGAFRLSIDSDLPGLRTIERLANFRSCRLRIPYGDQAIFVRKKTFQKMGGFPPVPILEDLEFMRELRKEGRLRVVPASVLTSSRRWRERGVIRTTLVNQLILLAHWLKTPPHDLLKVYRDTTTYGSLIKETCRIAFGRVFALHEPKR